MNVRVRMNVKYVCVKMLYIKVESVSVYRSNECV